MKDSAFRFRRPLSRQFLSAYLCLFGAIVLGLGFGLNWQFQRAVDKELRQWLQQKLAFHSIILSEPIHQRDVQRIGQLLAPLADDPAFVQAAVNDSHGKPLVTLGAAQPRSSEMLRERTAIYHPSGQDKGTVGTLSLTIDPQPFRTLMWSHLQNIIALVVFALIGILASSVICHHIFVRAPLKRLMASESALEGLNVLYVDGSELNRRLIDRQLSSWGMRPTTATDAHAAIVELNHAIQQGQPFPLTIIHHTPPVLDGHALSRAIRQDVATSATKILLITAEDKTSNISEPTHHPVDSLLTFPIHTQALRYSLSQLIAPPPQTNETTHLPIPQPLTQPPSTSVFNILLVEDNQVNQRVALAMLKKWGHRIDVAWNGLEAVEAVQRQHYDLVLMDIQMPEMDGITATQTIRQLQGEASAVPIVALTANAMQGDEAYFLAAGMNGYLAKPIDRDAFYALVHRYSARNRTVESEAQAASESELNPPILGLEELSYLLNELSGETVSELIDEYMTHSTSLLSQALLASNEQDEQSVEYAVHTLKGMSGALGALKMVDICQSILETCRNHGLHDLETQMNGLSGTTEETQQALNAWRSRHKESE